MEVINNQRKKFKKQKSQGQLPSKTTSNLAGFRHQPDIILGACARKKPDTKSLSLAFSLV